MSKKLSITINNKKYLADKNQTVLDVCSENNINIPALCKHPDLKIQGKCRVCLVELSDGRLVTSCSTPVTDGMKIKTNSPDVKRARATNLEMIYAEHIEKCSSCIQEESCALRNYAAKFGLKLTRYQDRKKDLPIWNFGAKLDKEIKKKLNSVKNTCPSQEIEFRTQQVKTHSSGYIQFDASKCIDCGICTEVCRDKQTCDFYETIGKGYKTQTMPKDSPEHDCTYCGQCVVHCPVGAIQGVPHWPEVDKILKNKPSNKIIIAQIAPSIRVSIGEEFGMDYGQVVTGQLAAAIKKLGFDLAFDVSLGADFTTYEEARELINWLAKGKDRPMLTSCCPGWVKFVEFYYPEFVPHLTTTRSPHIISAILSKTYYANLVNKDPQNIIVVSIMPCTAKKNEISLERHTIDPNWCTERLNLEHHDIATRCFVKRNAGKKKYHLPAVDYVLTTREFAYLLKHHKINFPKLKPREFDSPLGEHSGAAVIYGASGGVMESALRSADAFLRVKKKFGSLDSLLLGQSYEKNKKKLSKIATKHIEFKSVRGMDGIKEANVDIAGTPLKVAVVNGLGNARELLDALRDREVKYDYVEVMACPGGCIGGGGQPVPTTATIRAKRAASLYTIDKSKKIRAAHDNLSLLKIYRDYFKGDESIIEELLHCDYRKYKDSSKGYR